MTNPHSAYRFVGIGLTISLRPTPKGWPFCLIFVVGCEWLEHSTYGLRVRCSTN